MCTAVPHVTCNQQHATGRTPGTFQSFCGHCFSGQLHVKRHDLDAKSCDQRPEGGGCSPRAVWLVGDERVGLQRGGRPRVARNEGAEARVPDVSATDACCNLLERSGHAVTRLPAESCGIISVEKVADAITSKTALVTVIHAQNEIGTLQPVREIAAAWPRERDRCWSPSVTTATAAVSPRKWQGKLPSCAGRSVAGTNALSHRYQQPAALATGCF